MEDPLGRFIGFRLGAAHRRVDRLLNRALESFGISQAHAHLLTCLFENGEQRVADLAQCTGLEQSTVSRLIRQLARRRIVRRRPHPDDRRARLWRPARRALALRTKLDSVLWHAQRRLTRELTERDREGFLHTVTLLDQLP